MLQVHSGTPHTKWTNLPQIQLKSPSLPINIYHVTVKKKTQANNESCWPPDDKRREIVGWLHKIKDHTKNATLGLSSLKPTAVSSFNTKMVVGGATTALKQNWNEIIRWMIVSERRVLDMSNWKGERNVRKQICETRIL